jgi:hypothetical protein
MKLSKLLLLLAPAISLACGNRAVDLDTPHAPRLSASEDPNVLAITDERVTSLAVDGERLFWITSQFDGAVYPRTNLRSCKKDSCPGSLITYDTGHPAVPVDFGVQGGEVYWFRAHNPDGSNTSLLACNTAGCDHGSRTVAGSVPGIPMAVTFGGDAAYVYTRVNGETGIRLDNGLYRIPLVGIGGAPSLIAKPEGDAVSLAIGGEYLYWLTERADQSVITGTNSLHRMLTDGSASEQLLADDLVLVGSNQHRLAVGPASAYFSQSILFGSIERCPLAGCAADSGPEPFVAPVRAPTTLWLDGGHLYWARDTATTGYAISTCKLEDCTPEEVVPPGLADIDATAFDEEYVYTAAANTAVSNGQTAADSIELPLRRFPKEPQ